MLRELIGRRTVLTKLKINDFKRLQECEFDLGDVVVFVGPNNSGKTSALQSLLLWSAGVKEWVKQRGSSVPIERPGITMSRLALTQIPLRHSKHLWRDLHVTDNARVDGEPSTKPIFLDIAVCGEDARTPWTCGFEFYYANPESFYCRPLRTGGSMMVPEQAPKTNVALLPPLSGLSPEEPELQLGRINVLLGQGRSGEILRNMCLRVEEKFPDSWEAITRAMRDMFSVELKNPVRDTARGIVELAYREHGVDLDITSAGRGLQQVLLLLAHMHGNPGAVLLLDEPDAHLEVIRQRQIYSTLADLARSSRSQIIVASHSEIVLQESTDRDVVISFVGRPRRVDDRGSQVLKALKEIRAEDYYQAERKGFVLYLEGSTDLAILRSVASLIDHPASTLLAEPFVVYVANQPTKASEHFHGLRQAKPDLKSFALFDSLGKPGLPDGFNLPNRIWRRREIENYIASPDILMRFASEVEGDDLVSRAQRSSQVDAMKASIMQVEAAFRSLRREAWSEAEKLSDDVLAPIFENYYEKLGRDNRMAKTNYHVLVSAMTQADVSQEFRSVLDDIAASGPA